MDTETGPYEYEATAGGTWADGSDFAAGDRVAELPAQDKAWLVRQGVFRRVKRAAPPVPVQESAPQEAPDAAD